jgi:pimeloyl-ACP methyl ester carboxylesterase
MVKGYFRPLIVKGHMRSQAKQMKDREREQHYNPGAITQPVLVMHGEHDRVIPSETGDELAAQIPAAEIRVIRSAGHLPLEEQAAECNAILLQFLARPSDQMPGARNGALRESVFPIS